MVIRRWKRYVKKKKGERVAMNSVVEAVEALEEGLERRHEREEQEHASENTSLLERFFGGSG